MAEIVNEYKRQRRTGPKPKYPWETWLDGRQRRIRHGQDFTCSLSSMEDGIRKTARRKKLRVSVFGEPDATPPALVIQSLGPLSPPKKKAKPKAAK